MGKRVQLTRDYVIGATTIAKDTIGEIVTLPVRDDSPMASQPDIENGVVKVSFLEPKTITIGVPVDSMDKFFIDVAVDATVTPHSA